MVEYGSVGQRESLGFGYFGHGIGVIGLGMWTPHVSRDRVRLGNRRPLKGVVRQRKSLWFWCFEHIHSGRLIGLKTWTPRVDARPSLSEGAHGAESPPDLAPFATVLRGGCIKSRWETGSTTWARDCHGFGGGACVEAPLGPEGGRRHVPSKPLRGKATGRPGVPSKPFGQSSSELALKPAGGHFKDPESQWSVVHGLQSRLLWFRVRSRLGFDGDCWGVGDVRLATWPCPGPEMASVGDYW